MNRKGQAAVEFLMTYGWAILAAIIAIGVLAYFGVFSPGKFTPTATVVNAPFYANAWNVKGTGIVSLELKNNGGETFNVTSVGITPSTGATSCADDSIVGAVSASSTVTATVDCSTGISTIGNNFKGDITVKYTKSGSTLELTSTGTIADKIVS